MIMLDGDPDDIASRCGGECVDVVAVPVTLKDLIEALDDSHGSPESSA